MIQFNMHFTFWYNWSHSSEKKKSGMSLIFQGHIRWPSFTPRIYDLVCGGGDIPLLSSLYDGCGRTCWCEDLKVIQGYNQTTAMILFCSRFLTPKTGQYRVKAPVPAGGDVEYCAFVRVSSERQQSDAIQCV